MPTQVDRCRCWPQNPTGRIYGDQDTFTKTQESWIRAASIQYYVCVQHIRRWVLTWRCRICDADISAPKAACLDHDHTTGHARGVICRPCNLGLSYIDNPIWLDKAISYVNHHDAKVQRRPDFRRTLHPNAVHLPPPVTHRLCRCRVTTEYMCTKNALPFLREPVRCRSHATPEQLEVNKLREAEWRTLAEGLYWATQALWMARDVASEEAADAAETT